MDLYDSVGATAASGVSSLLKKYAPAAEARYGLSNALLENKAAIGQKLRSAGSRMFAQGREHSRNNGNGLFGSVGRAVGGLWKKAKDFSAKHELGKRLGHVAEGLYETARGGMRLAKGDLGFDEGASTIKNIVTNFKGAFGSDKYVRGAAGATQSITDSLDKTYDMGQQYLPDKVQNSYEVARAMMDKYGVSGHLGAQRSPDSIRHSAGVKNKYL